MNYKLIVKAEHGDCGGKITEVSVITDLRLTSSNIPDLKMAEVKLDSFTSESWAYIDLESQFDRYINPDDYLYEKYEDEYEPPIPSDKLINSRLGVIFSTHYYNEINCKSATWKKLNNSLSKVIDSCVYVKKTYRNPKGDSVEYIYNLPVSIFK